MGVPSFSLFRCRRAERTDSLGAVFPPPFTLLHGAARRIHFAMLMTIGMLATGCTAVPMAEPVSAPANAKPPAGNTSVAIPAPGATVAIRDGAKGEQVTVMFGKNYMAASGRRCAYYYEPGTDAVTGKGPSGIACQARAGGWTSIPARIPVTPGP